MKKGWVSRVSGLCCVQCCLGVLQYVATIVVYLTKLRFVGSCWQKYSCPFLSWETIGRQWDFSCAGRCCWVLVRPTAHILSVANREVRYT